MSSVYEAMGIYVQKPAPINIFAPELAGSRLHALYDALGYCVAIVVLSPPVMTQQGAAILVRDLRVEPHVPLRAVLAAMASRLFDDVGLVLYQRQKSGRVLTKQVAVGPQMQRWRNRAGLSHLTLEPDASLVPFHRRTGIRHERIEAVEFGRLAMVLAARQLPAMQAFDQQLARVRTWMLLQQYKVFEHADGTPAGIVSWAWLDHEVLGGAPPLAELHPGRWNEGRALCLCDVILAPSVLQAAQDFVQHDLFPNETALWMYPRHQGREFLECTKLDRESAAAALSEHIPGN